MHGVRHGTVRGLAARRRRAAVAAAAAGPHAAVMSGVLRARVAIRGRTSPALILSVTIIIPRFSGARWRRTFGVTAAASRRSRPPTGRWRIAASLLSVAAGWRWGAAGVRIAVRRRRCAALLVTLCGGAARGARTAPVRGRMRVGTAAAAASVATIAPEGVFALAVTHSSANLWDPSLLFKIAVLRRPRVRRGRAMGGAAAARAQGGSKSFQWKGVEDKAETETRF